MAKISVYLPLSNYLEKQVLTGNNEAKLSFTAIEKLIRRELPPSARKYENWWGNSHTEKGRQCSAWLDYGWKKEEVVLKDEYVIFRYMP